MSNNILVSSLHISTLSPIPESADGTSINIARPSSALPTLINQSSTIHVANIAMPVTSKAFFNLPAQGEHCLLIESNLQVIKLVSLGVEWSSTRNKFYLSPLVCINPKPLSFIIHN